MKKRPLLLVIMLFLVMLSLTGCMPGDGSYTTQEPAGFFWGVWHGWIAPLSLIFGFIDHETRIYEVMNIGWWYDFGFYIAIISGFGGISLFRGKKKD